MDLLLHLKVAIIGEVNLPIRLCLVGRGESEIKVVLSHPQPLAQCRQYLKRNFPQAEIRTTGSTSHAAKLAQEFPEMAAVAEAGTAEKYGLQILAREIQDASENITRFIVAGRTIPEPSGKDDYYFYIDLEGHVNDVLVKEALEAVKGKAGMVKVLGSYPRAQGQ
jgi:prephenate dehydratase